VRAHQAAHPIATLCRVLGVSASGDYAWTVRPASARATADGALSEQIRALHTRSRGTYGERRVHAELAAHGVHVGRKRITRLMRAMGLAGVSRRNDHHVPRSRRTARPGSRRSPLHRPRSGSALGRGHHVHPNVGRLALPCRRPRRVEPARGWLGDGHPFADRARARRAQHGGYAAPAHERHPPLGSGVSAWVQPVVATRLLRPF
jgi:transposase InsO family protein